MEFSFSNVKPQWLEEYGRNWLKDIPKWKRPKLQAVNATQAVYKSWGRFNIAKKN